MAPESSIELFDELELKRTGSDIQNAYFRLLLSLVSQLALNQEAHKAECPFLIDTGADVSLLPLEVVQRHALPVTRQPVMVDGSTLRRDGIVSIAVQL